MAASNRAGRSKPGVAEKTAVRPDAADVDLIIAASRALLWLVLAIPGKGMLYRWAAAASLYRHGHAIGDSGDLAPWLLIVTRGFGPAIRLPGDRITARYAAKARLRDHRAGKDSPAGCSFSGSGASARSCPWPRMEGSAAYMTHALCFEVLGQFASDVARSITHQRVGIDSANLCDPHRRPCTPAAR